MAMDYPDNTKINMIGAIRECPAKDRDESCCYRSLIDLDLVKVNQMIDMIPVEHRNKMIEFCKECSYQKLISTDKNYPQ